MGLLSALGGLGAANPQALQMGILPMLLGGGFPYNDQQPGGPRFGGGVNSDGTMSFSGGGSGGLQGAFSNNPQFQQQLQALLSRQSPGFSPPSYTPPPTRVLLNAPTPGDQPIGVSGVNNIPLGFTRQRR